MMTLEFRAADSVEHALATFGVLGSDAQPLAGGTDVMIQLRLGQLAPKVLVHLEPLAPELRTHTVDGQRVRIGALTTHEDVIAARKANAALPHAPALAASQVGAWQTQTLGTVAGNIANASPAADLVPALLIHDASVELSSVEGVRELPLARFVTGRRQTARRPEELITAISYDLLPPGTTDTFLKVGRRSAMEVSIIAVAARLTVDPATGTITDARIAVGAASPVPYRANEAEQMLIGQVPSAELLRAASMSAADRAEPIDDIRSSKRYRTLVLPRAIGRALESCVNDSDNRAGSAA